MASIWPSSDFWRITDVDHADRPGLDQRDQLGGHLAGEVAGTRRKLDHHVVDGTKFV